MAEKKSSDIEYVLKNAAEESLSQQGTCFTVDSAEPDENGSSLAYDTVELSEYMNFDMLVEENDDLDSFQSLVADTNLEDLTGNKLVMKALLNHGTGEVVQEDSVVMIHYTAFVLNNHEPFDVTYLQDLRPKCFTIGYGDLLPGLEIGVKSMKSGETARFIIKPDLAFKTMGCPPRIPPNATIVFDVHLVAQFSKETFLLFDENNRDPEKFIKVLVQVKKFHIEGNEQFKNKFIDEAVSMYTKAIEILHLSGYKTDEEKEQTIKYLDKLYTNLSLCYLKLCAFSKVCLMGKEAVKYSYSVSKNNTKLHFNWGKALRLLKRFAESKEKFKKALQLEPYNDTIQIEMQRLEKDIDFNIENEIFTFDGGVNNRLPPEFWELFSKRLTHFLNSDDDILTFQLIQNTDDIKLAKNKAISLNLHFQVIKRAHETSLIAVKKN